MTTRSAHMPTVWRRDCTSVGTFSQEMYDMAKKQGWIVVSMKDDWRRIFAFE